MLHAACCLYFVHRADAACASLYSKVRAFVHTKQNTSFFTTWQFYLTIQPTLECGSTVTFRFLWFFQQTTVGTFYFELFKPRHHVYTNCNGLSCKPYRFQELSCNSKKSESLFLKPACHRLEIDVRSQQWLLMM